MNRTDRLLTGAIAALVLGLLLVGVVSGTILRHVVQCIPAGAAAFLLRSRPVWGRPATIPIFAFWLFVMTLIWLYVLGVARVISGRFTPVEVLLTIVMGLACLAGLGTAPPALERRSWLTSAAAILLFLGLQFGFMRLSFLPFLANR